MKSLPLIALFASLIVAFTLAEEKFNPKVAIDHQGYINQALARLLTERPEIDPKNLSCIGLNYRFNFAEGTRQVCGPNGCEIKQVAPFREELSVSFQVLDSGRDVEEDGRKVTKYDGIQVIFPTPSQEDWSIGPFHITSYN